MAITRSQIKNVKFEDFDPNNFMQDREVWAIYDGFTFRTLASRGPALTSFMAQTSAKLYWMQPDGRWREVAVRDHPRCPGRNCDWCGGKVDQNWGWYTPWVWEKFGGKIPPGPDGVKLLFLCGTCRDLNG